MSLTLLPPRRRARLSLTPLIDVVFILLLFFMLTSSFARDAALELRAPSVSVAAPTEDGVVVELTPDGLTLAGERVGLRRLALRAAPLVGGGEPVAVRVAEGVPLTDLVAVLDALRAAGATELSVSRGAS